MRIMKTKVRMKHLPFLMKVAVSLIVYFNSINLYAQCDSTLRNGDFEVVKLDVVEVFKNQACYDVNSNYILRVNNQVVPLLEHKYYEYVGAPNIHLNVLFASFYFTDTVIVEIKKTSSSIGTYSISPLKFNITPEKTSNTLTFAINSPKQLYIDIDGTEILLFAEAKLTNKPQESGTGIFNITSYGASSNSNYTVNQATAIQNAINAASAYGISNGTRGTVYVPAGLYYTTNLDLKDSLNIYLEGGAVIRGTGRSDDYGTGTGRLSMFNAEGSASNFIENVKIYGPGIIDANGVATAKVDNIADLYDKINLRNGHLLRLISMDYVKNIDIEDVIAMEGSSWQLSFHESEKINIERVKVIGHRTMKWNDGIDVSACKNVVIRDCFAIGFDDNFCIKDDAYQVSENILIENAVGYSHSRTFKIGFQAGAGVRNCTIRNVDAVRSRHACHLMQSTGTGATWEDILIENYVVEKLQPSDPLDSSEPAPFRIQLSLDNGIAKNIAVKNFTFLGDNYASSPYDSDLDQEGINTTINNIAFTNFKVGGNYATNNVQAYLDVNTATNITFNTDQANKAPVYSNVPVSAILGSNATPKYWQLTGSGAFEDATAGRSGRAISLEPHAGGSYWQQQLCNLNVGSTYWLKGFIKTENISGGYAAMVVGQSDTSQKVSGTTGWSEVSIEFVADAQTKNIFCLFDATNGKAFFDDITFIATPTGVSVEPSILSITKGDTKQLRASAIPENGLDLGYSWQSNNPSVAFVDQNGLLTAIAAGNADIIAISKYNNSFSDTCTVKVLDKVIIKNYFLEAESASGQTLFSPFEVVDDNSASGKKYIVTNLSNTTASNAITGQAAYTFELAENTNVTFSVIADFPAGGDDSFFYKMDNGSWQTQNGQTTSGWDTLEINEFNSLSAGTHTLTLLRRENGAKIDKVFFSTPKAVIITDSVAVIVPVDKLVLSAASISLAKGQSGTLTTQIFPADATIKAITYSSGSPSVATVSQSGLVTAIAVGSATITVTSAADGSKTDVCTVTVTPAVVAVDSIKIAPKSLALAIGQTSTLGTTVYPDGATNSAVTYSSGSPSVATVSQSGLVTAIAVGSATITVTSAADGSKTDVCTVTVTDPGTNLILDKLNESLRAYPNPFNNQVVVTFNTKPNSNIAITLHNVTGKELIINHYKPQTLVNNELVLSTAHLPGGVYFIKVMVGTNINTSKIIKLVKH